jgi:hypothetical protein
MASVIPDSEEPGEVTDTPRDMAHTLLSLLDLAREQVACATALVTDDGVLTDEERGRALVHVETAWHALQRARGMLGP